MRKLACILMLLLLLLILFYEAAPSAVNANPVSPPGIYPIELWKSSLAGSMIGTPLVTDKYIYVNSWFQIPSGNVYCLDVSTGQQVWNFSTAGPLPLGGRPFTPILEGNNIYFGVDQGTLYSLDAYTGEKIWSFSPGGSMNGRGSHFGDYIYASFGNRVYALNASSGTQIWNQQVGDSAGDPLVIGGFVYLTGNVSENSSHGIISCLNASTGTKRWSSATTEYLGYPFYLNRGYIYVGANSHSADNLATYDSKVYAFDPSNGAEVWSAPTGSFPNGPISVPFMFDQSVFVRSGDTVYAFNASNGERNWSYATAGSTSSFLFSGSHVYVGGGDSVYCLDTETGRKIWNYTTEIPRANSSEILRVSSPVGADGQIIVGSIGPQYSTIPLHHIYALNASTGEEIWSYVVEGNVDRIRVEEEVLYVSSSFATPRNQDDEGNSTLYALKPTFFPGSTPPKPIIVTLLPMILAFGIIGVGVILIALAFVFRRKPKENIPSSHFIDRQIWRLLGPRFCLYSKTEKRGKGIFGRIKFFMGVFLRQALLLRQQ